jgi:hypothetical protein
MNEIEREKGKKWERSSEGGLVMAGSERGIRDPCFKSFVIRRRSSR